MVSPVDPIGYHVFGTVLGFAYPKRTEEKSLFHQISITQAHDETFEELYKFAD